MEKKTQIKELRRKAEISRNAYFLLSKRYENLNKILHFFTLVGSTIVAILTFANYTVFLPIFKEITDSVYKILIGMMASFVFILTVIEEFLKLSVKSTEFESAGKQLTTFIRYADSFEKKDNITDDDLFELIRYYTFLFESTPIIPDRYFFKAKKQLYKKIEISKEIDKNYNLIIWIYNFKKKFKAIISLFKKSGDKE